MQSFTRFLALAAAAAPFFAQAAPVGNGTGMNTKPFRTIPGKWIVTLKPDVDIAAVASHHVKVREIHARNLARRGIREATGGVEHKFGLGTFNGYSGAFDDVTAEELNALPEVLAVEPDTIMTTLEAVTQRESPWGLAALSSREPDANDYIYDSSAGEGQFNYVVDTGIRTTHEQFEGRASWGYNFANSDNNDNVGHGTHVAGTIGGITYGVAKKTNLIAVKVFEGNQGDSSTVIAGFEWAANDIVSMSRQNTAVINLSLGGAASTAWDSAITAAYDEGVLAVCSAGNTEQDAENNSPGRSPETITVGNLEESDVRHVPSSYGSVVDIFAPGTGILSAYKDSDTATKTATGTSMAAPHVAGLVSYIRGLEGPMNAEAVKTRVFELATAGRVEDTQGAANLVAFNGNGVTEPF